MKKNHFYYAALVFLTCQFSALFVSAQANEPIIAFATITGAKSGDIRGGSTMKETEGMIECVGFKYTVKSPRDPASGLATGKHQEGEIIIAKHLDIATPLLLNVMYTNETLKSVTIRFYKKNPTGLSVLFQTIQLTNASIAEIAQNGGTFLPDKSVPAANTNEQIAFTFQKITITNMESKTSAMDDWEARQ
jgi:type VI secretion system secreted protein Hcp